MQTIELGLANLAGLRYAREVGPTDPELSLEKLVAVGLNCQLWLHWALEELCCLTLPKDYLSSHIWADTVFSRVVQPCEPLQVGDILFSYGAATTHPSQLHMAVLVEFSTAGAAVFSHVIKRRDPAINPSLVTWTVQEFLDSRLHQHLYGVKRITAQRMVHEYGGVTFDAPDREVTALSAEAVARLQSAATRE